MFSRVFLESPYLLIPLLAVGMYGLLYRWAQRRTPASGWAVGAGLMMTVVLLVMQTLVVTPREAAVTTCRALADAVVREDFEFIRRAVAPEFTTDGHDREAFLAIVERALSRYDVRDVRLRDWNVQVLDAQRTQAEFSAIATISTDTQAGQVMSRWQLVLVRHGPAWRITRIAVVPSPMSPVRSLRDIR